MTGNLQKSELLALAKNVFNYINTNKQALDYVSSSLGKIQFQSLVFVFSKILSFIRLNGILSNFLSVNIKTTDKININDGDNNGGSTGEVIFANLVLYLKATKLAS